MKKLYIDECGFHAHFFPIEGTKSRVIIILGGSEGGLPNYNEDEINRFHKLRLSVLYVAYFGADKLPDSLESISLEYFEIIFKWLSEQPGIVSDEYIVLGTSKGGELALLLGSLYQQIKCVIAAVPSCAVWQGIPNGISKTPCKSSWSYNNIDLPFVILTFSIYLLWGILTKRFFKAYEKALSKVSMGSKALISVENINGPVLLMSGQKDVMWPSVSMCDMIIQRLASNNFSFEYEHIIFDSGHFVGNDKDYYVTIEAFLKNKFL